MLDHVLWGAGGFYCSLKALRKGIRIKNKNIAFYSKNEFFPPIKNLN
jgi:hypothetical protein